MSEEGYSIDPLDMPPVWQEVTSQTTPVNIMFGVLIGWITFILMLCSPAVVIAVWKWLL